MKEHKIGKSILVLSFAALGLAGCGGDAPTTVTGVDLVTPLKSAYGVGEIIDLSSLQVRVSYSNQNEEIFYATDSRVTCEGMDTENVGEHSLKFTVDGFAASFSYLVEQRYVTLDYNGGTFEGETSAKVALYNNRCDLSSYLPVSNDETKEFSGWFYDAEALHRATYLVSDVFESELSVTLYAGYDLMVGDRYLYSIDTTTNKATLLSLNFDNYFAYMDEPEMVIPATIQGYPVTEIASDFLIQKESLFGDDFNWATMLFTSTISFAEGSQIQKIGDRAFYGMTQLTSVEFPDSLGSIGDEAFSGTKLSGELHFGKNLRRLGESAFSYNAGCIEKISFAEGSQLKVIGSNCFASCPYLSNVELPEGLEEIRTGAFMRCDDLAQINIPSTVRIIEAGAFKLMQGLQQIVVSETNPYFSSLDGSLYSQDMTKLYSYCHRDDVRAFTLPSTVTSIENGAFNIYSDYSSLRTLNLLEGLKYIGKDAFSGCDFDFTLPASLNSFSLEAFSGYVGKAINVSTDNPKYASKDGILYSKDFKTVYCAPGGLDAPRFVLDSRVEIVGENAFTNMTGIYTFVIPADSQLKEVRKSGLLFSSFPTLRVVEIQKKVLEGKLFSFTVNSFYNPSSYNLDFLCVFDDPNSLSLFRQEIGLEDRSVYSDTLFTKDDIVSNAVDYIENSFEFTPFNAFENGVSPYLYVQQEHTLSSMRRVLSFLSAAHQSEKGTESQWKYLKAFEKAIYASFVSETEDKAYLNSDDLTYYQRLCTLFDELPKAEQDELQPAMEKMKTIPFYAANGEFDALYRDILAFEATPDQFSAEEYEALQKRIESSNMERVAVPNRVYTKKVLLDADYKINQVLNNQEDTHENIVRIRAILENSAANNYYGLNSYISGWFPTEKRKSLLYRYDEFAEFVTNFSEMEENDTDRLIQSIDDFDLSSFDLDRYYAFYESTISYFFLDAPGLLNGEEYKKCNQIACMINIATLLDSSYYETIDDDNFLEAYSLVDNIEAGIEAYELTSADLIRYEEYQAKATKVSEYTTQYCTSLGEDIDGFTVDAEHLISDYPDLAKRYAGLGPWANGLLGGARVTSFKALTASYYITVLFEKFPSVDESEYNELKKFLYGYLDVETFEFQQGISQSISDAVDYLYYDTTGVYRYEDYQSLLATLTAAND